MLATLERHTPPPEHQGRLMDVSVLRLRWGRDTVDDPAWREGFEAEVARVRAIVSAVAADTGGWLPPDTPQLLVVFAGDECPANDAVRACRASLAIVEKLHEPGHRGARPGVGVNTGLAFLCGWRFSPSDLHCRRGRTRPLVGDAVRVADRLAGHAPEGMVVIGDATRQAGRGLLLTEGAGVVATGDRGRLVPAHLLLGVAPAR